MAYHLELVNLDQLFETATVPPIIVNDFNVSSKEDKERLNRLIYTRYEGDSLEALPSCECGETRGEYNVGIHCPNCGTVVMSVTERPLESALWLMPPAGVATFINPEVYAIFSDYLTRDDVNLFEYLVNPNPTIQLPVNPTSREMRVFAGLNIPRGINYFHKHFDKIIETLFEYDIFKLSSQQAKDEMAQFIRLYRDCIFTRHLPIPSKLVFITEQAGRMTYVDQTIADALEAIRTISASSPANMITPLSIKSLQDRAMKANAYMTAYHQNFIVSTLSRKPGMFRKHWFGGRSHFTFRAVITSLSDNHAYDECHLPWSVAVMALKLHLSNKLLKRGMTPKQRDQFLHEHTLRYHPLLDEIFQELINETPWGGIPVIIHRNPSLQRGSAQAFYATKIKTNPADNSIAMSVLTLVAPNADFDGDRLVSPRGESRGPKTSLIAGNSFSVPLGRQSAAKLPSRKNVQRLSRKGVHPKWGGNGRSPHRLRADGERYSLNIQGDLEQWPRREAILAHGMA